MVKNIIKSNEGEWVKHPAADGVYLKHFFAGEDNGGLFNNLEAKIEAGAELPLHVHENAIETYYVVQGKGECYQDGEWKPVQEGDCCSTPIAKEHGFRNSGDKDCILVSTFTPPIR